MVDNFQKQYESLQIPYPKDNWSSKVESEASQVKSAYDKFVADSKSRVAAITAEKAKWEAMMPVEGMNMEEAMDYVPHMLKAHPDKPSLWPHDQDYEEWHKMIVKLRESGEADH